MRSSFKGSVRYKEGVPYIFSKIIIKPPPPNKPPSNNLSYKFFSNQSSRELIRDIMVSSHNLLIEYKRHNGTHQEESLYPFGCKYIQIPLLDKIKILDPQFSFLDSFSRGMLTVNAINPQTLGIVGAML